MAMLKFGWSTNNMETIPSPSADGFKISREKVWNSKAARSSKALFNGTVVARKVTLDMSFPPNLTNAQRKLILKYANADTDTYPSRKYCYIQFVNEAGENETKRFYFGNPSFDAHVFLNGKYLSQSFSVQAVER